MKRDMGLIRRLMLDLESANTALTNEHEVPGYTAEQVPYHLGLVVRDGLADGPAPTYNMGNTTQIPHFVLALRLTPTGHDFIDTLRDDTVWRKVKEQTVKVDSSVSLEMLKAIGKTVVSQTLGIGT